MRRCFFYLKHTWMYDEITKIYGSLTEINHGIHMGYFFIQEHEVFPYGREWHHGRRLVNNITWNDGNRNKGVQNKLSRSDSRFNMRKQFHISIDLFKFCKSLALSGDPHQLTDNWWRLTGHGNLLNIQLLCKAINPKNFLCWENKFIFYKCLIPLWQ